MEEQEESEESWIPVQVAGGEGSDRAGEHGGEQDERHREFIDPETERKTVGFEGEPVAGFGR